jgi:transcriptional regulator with XRE-family HTH domain
MVSSTVTLSDKESSVTNSLGSYVQEQMGLLGWSREALVERSGLDRYEVEAILDSPVLVQWPEPEVMLSIARAFNVELRDVVLHSARACGLHVDLTPSLEESVSSVPNDELMREVRRRLTLGAATGGYLANPSSCFGADSGAQFL